jgi:hypothetical protein
MAQVLEYVFGNNDVEDTWKGILGNVKFWEIYGGVRAEADLAPRL